MKFHHLRGIPRGFSKNSSEEIWLMATSFVPVSGESIIFHREPRIRKWMTVIVLGAALLLITGCGRMYVREPAQDQILNSPSTVFKAQKGNEYFCHYKKGSFQAVLTRTGQLIRWWDVTSRFSRPANSHIWTSSTYPLSSGTYSLTARARFIGFFCGANGKLRSDTHNFEVTYQGPGPLDPEWNSTGGPSGESYGSLRALAFDPANNLIYAGSNGGGVFKLASGGGAWQSVHDGLTSAFVYALFVESGGVVYAGTSDGVFTLPSGGTTWLDMGQGQYINNVTAIYRASNGTIYAGRQSVVSYLTSGSTVWDNLWFNSSVGQVQSLTYDSATSTLYAGTELGGVFKLPSGASTWQEVNAGLSSPEDRNVIALAVDSVGNVYAGTSGGGVFRMTAGSSTWTELNTGLGPTAQELYVNSFAVDGSGNVYAGLGYSHYGVSNLRGVFKLPSGASSWVAMGPDYANVGTLVIDAAGTLYAGGDSFYTLPSATSEWEEVNAGLAISNVHVLVFDPASGDLYAGTHHQGIFRRPNGATWEAINTGLGNFTINALVVSPDGAIYAGTGEAGNVSGVLKLSSTGTSWQEWNTDLTNLWVSSLILDAESDTLYAGTNGGGVFTRSIATGTSWQTLGTGLQGEISALVRVADGTLYAGTSEGVFKLAAGATTWETMNIGLSNTYVNALVIDQNGTLYAGTGSTSGASAGNAVFKFLNGGTSWQLEADGLPYAARASSLAFDSTGTLYAGTNGGVYSLPSGATVWQKVNTGFINPLVLAITVDGSGNIYAGTDGGGVFEHGP